VWKCGGIDVCGSEMCKVLCIIVVWKYECEGEGYVEVGMCIGVECVGDKACKAFHIAITIKLISKD
jgi:hypothetical protein